MHFLNNRTYFHSNQLCCRLLITEKCLGYIVSGLILTSKGEAE
jgi:hypothetical protein